jgi:hypothetical protein
LSALTARFAVDTNRKVDVIKAQLMTALADVQPTVGIFVGGNDFEMSRIDAITNTAQVIDHHTIGDVSAHQDVRIPMRQHGLSADAENTVSVAHRASRPQPTIIIVGLDDLIPKPIISGKIRGHLDRLHNRLIEVSCRERLRRCPAYFVPLFYHATNRTTG